MLRQPRQTAGLLLETQFRHAGGAYLRTAYCRFFTVVVGLAGRIWLHCKCQFAGWPYKLACLGESDLASSRARDVVDDLFAAGSCCLDRGISQKLRQMHATGDVAAQKMRIWS